MTNIFPMKCDGDDDAVTHAYESGLAHHYLNYITIAIASLPLYKTICIGERKKFAGEFFLMNWWSGKKIFSFNFSEQNYF